MALFNIDELERIARSSIRLDERFGSESYQIDDAMQTYSRFDYTKVMDGIKGKVAICPLTKNRYATEYQGQEYLGLYPYVTETASMLWINEDSKHYNRFERWLDEK